MSKESKTLFVRNLSFTVGKDDLEGYFSEYGPVKRCFVVQDNVTGKSRGFGYVTYTLREDAVKAHNSKHKWEGRPMHVVYADIARKVKRKKKKTQNEATADSETDEEHEHEEPEKVVLECKTDKPVKGTQSKSSESYHKSKIVLLSGLPGGLTDAALTSCLQKLNVKSVAESKVVGENEAQVKFKCIRDAKRAIRKLHNQTYADCTLQACQLAATSKEGKFRHTAEDQQQSRVIVRNLAFKCKDEDIQKAFEACGNVTEVKLPVNTEGKMLGFGFVQFSSVSDAAKAIELMNTKKILGRPVAVDWAVPKRKFEKVHNQGQTDNTDHVNDDMEITSENDEEEAKETVSDSHNESADDEEVPLEEQTLSSLDSEDSGDDTDKQGLSEAESEDSDDDSDENEEDYEDGNSAGKKKPHVQKDVGPSDCDEGKTIFIRNLSFGCNEQQLEEYFEQFGELEYAKVVLDRDTDHSRGMGFVKYRTKDSAESCLAKAESSQLVLQGRILNVTVAVSRNQAGTFKQKEKKEQKDARNLHLAREGLIRPGTHDAIGLSKADLEKRMKVESVKRQKLKNINVFISPLRLCVRNIPVNVDEKQLKKVFHEAAGQKAAKVTECRIMRDRARVNTEGVAKSMGFGFVSFSEHQHALQALRTTNNNPEIFGEKRRLIVEFSLENKKALEAKEKRRERAKAKQELFRSKSGGDSTAASKKAAAFKPGKSPGVASLRLSEKDRQAKGNKPLPKGLPSHWGPKVRHKPRQAQKHQQIGQGKKSRLKTQPPSLKRSAENWLQGPSGKKPRRGAKIEHDHFDKLVDKYRNRMGNRSKWFDK